MICERCHSRFIVSLENISVNANAVVRICKDKIRIVEIYSNGLDMGDSQPITFICSECENDLTDTDNAILMECTECYEMQPAGNIVFVESKTSPVCINCFDRNFSDEIATPSKDIFEILVLEI